MSYPQQTSRGQRKQPIRNNTQKQRGDFTAEAARKSALEFGHTFSGSLGFVFTIPNERLIAVDSDLDLAIGMIFDMAKAQDPKSLSTFAKQIGIAPIRFVYRWAKDHIDSGLSADIQWERKDKVRASMLIQPPELERLVRVIDETSEVESEALSIYGQLVGGDTDKNTFHLKVDGEKDVEGKLDENFRKPQVFALNGYYMAHMIKKTKIHYATEKPDVTYFLTAIEEYVADKP